MFGLISRSILPSRFRISLTIVSRLKDRLQTISIGMQVCVSIGYEANLLLISLAEWAVHSVEK